MHQIGFRSSTFSAFVVATLVVVASVGRAEAQTSYLYAGVAYTNAATEVANGQANLAATLGRRFELGPMYMAGEVQLAVRGATRDELVAENAVLENWRLTNTYVDIPLMLGISGGRGVRPYVQAGPFLGMRVDSRTRYLVRPPHPGIIDVQGSMQRFDYGMIGGAGVMIDTRFYRLGIELRGQAGAVNVSDELLPGPMRSLTLLMGIVL